jgi:myosin heavy subunit
MDSNKLWQLYSEQMQGLAGPFMKHWKAAPDLFAQAQNGQGPDFSKMTQLYWDLYEQTFGDYLNSPTVGSTRELEAKMRYGFDVWMKSRKAEAEYNAVVGEAWLKAFDQFRQKLISLSESGEAITSLAELGAVWTDVAETAFGEVFGTEKYILAQGNYLNSSMALRVEQRKVLEMVLNQFDMPTRTEIDQAHKTNHQLRKEVKALKKAMAGVEKAEQSDSDALAKANKAIAAIQKENRELKKTVTALEKAQANTSAQKEVAATIKEMQKEIEALKKSAAPVAKPKPAPKRTTRAKKTPVNPTAAANKEGDA